MASEKVGKRKVAQELLELQQFVDDTERLTTSELDRMYRILTEDRKNVELPREAYMRRLISAKLEKIAERLKLNDRQ